MRISVEERVEKVDDRRRPQYIINSVPINVPHLVTYLIPFEFFSTEPF
jgi:hypothetical protein